MNKKGIHIVVLLVYLMAGVTIIVQTMLNKNYFNLLFLIIIAWGIAQSVYKLKRRQNKI